MSRAALCTIHASYTVSHSTGVASRLGFALFAPRAAFHACVAMTLPTARFRAAPVRCAASASSPTTSARSSFCTDSIAALAFCVPKKSKVPCGTR